MLVSHTTYFVSSVGTCHFYREVVQVCVSDLPGEIDKYEVIEISLAISSNHFHVFMCRFHQVHCGQPWTHLSRLWIDIKMKYYVAFSQIAHFENWSNQILSLCVINQYFEREQGLVQHIPILSNADLWAVLRWFKCILIVLYLVTWLSIR